ncbi:hypothetical protein F5144DRAFT_607889 [Chaetomium tenue]|uniref:Uncharacterized protein n=1 Tax=Chaetomium tenue TaxID=1854479 RepID=A0ACB7PKQ1_9PEZI|nr:hypothetical protein F5144DRAFT_607889 [Chaetomium globosum]
MDALRELSQAAPLEKQHNKTSEVSSRRSGTPSTSSEEASRCHTQSPEGGSSSLSSAENYKFTPDTTSSTIDTAPSFPLEAPPFRIITDSLPLTPSNSLGAPSWPAMSLHDHRRDQSLNEYYTQLEILMMDEEEVDGHANNADNVMDSVESSNAQSTIRHDETTPDFRHRLGASDGAGTADDHQRYRYGQLGVFRPFSRFDQASRPIASDNWRAKSATESGTRPQPQLPSLMTGNNTNNMVNSLSPVTPSSYPHLYTPNRSPMTAPLNANMAGFAHLHPNLNLTPSPHPPPTPVSLPTPTLMAFPGRSTGNGHVHHLSGSGFGTPNIHPPTPVGGNTSMAPISVQADSMALQMNNLALHHTRTLSGSYASNNNGVTQMIGGGGYGNGQDQGTATFPVTVSDNTLGYCFIRPNGTRTRLVPVDMLPYQLQGIPPQETGNEWLVSLPVPAGVGSDGRSTNNQVLRAFASPSGNSGGDTIQSHIDRILATPSEPQPPSPGYHHHHQHNNNTTHLGHTSSNSAQSSQSQTQTSLTPTSQDPNNHPSPSHTTTTTNTSPTTPVPTPINNKRIKVYCDKWVHEGVCAFTQQGCKYKHEMPADKATQHQLGLFLGYPVWWKRRQGELARVQQQQQQGAGAGAGGGGGGGGGSSSSGAASAEERNGAGCGSVDEEAGEGETEVASPTGPLSEQGPRRGAAVSGGLAASRWGGNFGSPSGSNGDGTEHGSARERLLPPSWRTPSSVEAAQRHPHPRLQSYDGADASPVSSHELSLHRHTAPEAERGIRRFIGATNNNINTHLSTPTALAAHDTRPRLWEEHHYVHRTLQPQPQSQPQGQLSRGGPAACPFATTATTTPTSPYGPIAPPPRNPRSTTTTTTTGVIRPAREVPNPYATAAPLQPPPPPSAAQTETRTGTEPAPNPAGGAAASAGEDGDGDSNLLLLGQLGPLAG